MKRSAISVLLLLLALRPGSPVLSGQNDFSELERVALAELAETGTPGMALAIVRGDRVVFSKGFGVANIETGESVTSDTLFQIGSFTKTFTATAVVSLAEERKVRLDSPVGNYVKGLKPCLARVTLHQLLSHSAGIKDESAEYGPHDETSLAEYPRSWNEDYCLIEPGKAFSYSNPGYSLAGLALQEVEGKPYANLMSERLFKPLGMQRTTFRPTVAMTYAIAIGNRAQGKEKPLVVRPFADDARQWPAGFMYSSAQELSRFAIALLNGGRIEGRQMISPAVIAKLMTAYMDVPGDIFDDNRYGYGLFVRPFRGIRIVEHSGSMPGFGCEFRAAPDHRFAVILLANREGVRYEKTISKAMEMMLPLKPEVTRQSKKPVQMSEAEMARFTGSYRNRWTMDIFIRDGKLYLRRFGAELEITPLGNNHFSVTPPGAAVPQEFVTVTGADGRAEFLQMFLWAFKKT